MKYEQLPRLYGKSTTGKIKQWDIEAQCWEDGAPALMTTKHGYEDGEIQETSKKVVGKNIGKSNETTNFEQALFNARSSWNRKIDDGYVTDRNNIPDASEVILFLPMLAHVYEKRSKYINLPAYVQPKLDGIRCLARKTDGKVTMWSRKGKILDIPIEIIMSLESFLVDGQVTDGELYVHGWTFQQIIKGVKKYREEITGKLEYHIYDCPDSTLGFNDRFVEGFSDEGMPSNLIKVETTLIESFEEAIEHLELALKRDYEGQMIRNYNGAYKFKNRSNDLQKMKKFLDAEYMVIGVDQASGRDEGTAVFVCQTNDGQEFRVRPMGTREERREYYDNFDTKYDGRLLTVKYQELTDDGIPRFPVGLHFRPEWDMS